MPLTEDQKRELDKRDEENTLPSNRLHLVTHAEICEAFAKALEFLVGGRYGVNIKSWSEADNHVGFGEKINMSATITFDWQAVMEERRAALQASSGE